MNPFKDAFENCDRKFTQPQGRAHIFIAQNIFSKRLSVAGYKLPFGDKICGSKFWQIFRGFILAYDDNCNYFESTHFRFCQICILISNVLMVRKEELFTKSPKLQ